MILQINNIILKRFISFNANLRIPVNVATQTAGKLPPKPVKVATLGGVVGA